MEILEDKMRYREMEKDSRTQRKGYKRKDQIKETPNR